MLTTRELDIESKPRKRVKVDTVNKDEYNEFKGQAIEIEQSEPTPVVKDENEKQLNIKDELSGYEKMFNWVKKNPKTVKKLEDLVNQGKNQVQEKVAKKVKIEEEPGKKPKSEKKKSQQKPISSNWKQFLQSKEKEQSKHKSGEHKSQYQFVAIDCQFVKSGETDCLARISLVNEHGDELYDTYVRPSMKITDFVTDVSGITYGHIKNAPREEEVIPLMKKKMLNKIIIGHTVDKDLEVCGLKDWKGAKKIIDIAEVHAYSPGGKRVSLKKLSYNHLGKVIQEGWHSSLEDAQATMQLFLKHKQDILKQKNVVKK